MTDLLKKVNDGIYAIERWIVVGASLFMAIIVFFDVVHRRYSAAESKIIEKLGKWTGMDPEGSTYAGLQDVSTFIVWALAFGLVYFGIRSASRRPLFEDVKKSPDELSIDPKKAAALSAGILVACWLVLRLLFGNGIAETIIECPETYTWDCGIYPNGVANWAQPLALVCTLWLGFLGASMATRDNRHLKVEALQRFMPEKAQRVMGLISALITSAFCIFMAMLAWRYVGYMHEDYTSADGLAGLHDGVDLPRYQTFLVVPFAYILMSMRFIAIGVLAARGELDTTPTELADLDLGQMDETDEAGDTADAETPAPAELTTADDGPVHAPEGSDAKGDTKPESEDEFDGQDEEVKS